jgi:uncharacterized protein
MKKLIFLIPFFALFSCSKEPVEKKVFLDSEGIPIPTHYFVNDFSGKMLDSAQAGKLNRRLKEYEDSTTNQIVVICLPNLPQNSSGGTWSIEDLGVETGRKWAIGQKNKDNGVLFLIAFEEHKTHIATGYGIEGALPDITCGYILDEDVQPLFKEEKYYEGIDKAITSMQRSIAGEYLADREAQQKENMVLIWFLVGLGICAILGAIFPMFIGYIPGGIYGGGYWYYNYADYSVLESLLALAICAVATLIVSALIRLFFTGDLGMSSSGSEIFSGTGIAGGGGGGGGFSGGGGSFGGGGASGGW